MKFGRTWKEQEEKSIAWHQKHRRPHRWFAWRPVNLDDGRTAWMERVVRHKTDVLGRWHYNDAAEVR